MVSSSSTYRSMMSTLHDAQGHYFPLVEQYSGSLKQNAEGQVMIFDIYRVKITAHLLKLHLRVPVIQMNERNSSLKVACETYSYSRFNPSVRTVTVKGSFLFNFEIKVNKYLSRT